MNRSISIRRIDEYLLRLDLGETEQCRTRLQEDIAEILWGGMGDPRRKFTRELKRDTVLDAQEASLMRCIEAIHGARQVDVKRVLSEWQPVPSERFVRLPLGKAEDGEIEVVGGLSTENLAAESVRRWVGVYVDSVRFWTRLDPDGRPHISEGSYVRIETPGRQHGAIVLPVDYLSGEVCLVTQFRHPQRALATEAPRGFADPGIDFAPSDAAERELDEEAGLRPRQPLVYLKESYTDTGKLADRPSLFLAWVDREEQVARLKAKSPPLEDPVWIPLFDFLEAIFARGEVELRGTPTFVEVGPHQGIRRSKSRLAQGYLCIEDAFTIQVALLALPHLKRQFPERFAERTGPWT